MAEERTISRKTVYQGRAVRVWVDVVLTPEGRETTREIVEHPDCVAIIALDDQDNLLLVRQFRKAIEKELLEIPAGGIDAGESPEQAVQREMRE
ncbi:MAG: NUDIX hydrolase, partial [Chloroflexota bacterium]